MAKHRHAEIIKAWADGSKIQYYCNLKAKWMEIDWPMWNNNTQYRIKPEPKPDVGFPVTVRLTLIFDGETYQLKNAEVIK